MGRTSRRTASYARSQRKSYAAARSKKARMSMVTANRYRSFARSYAPTVQRAIGFSRVQFVKLRYCQQVTLNPSASSNANIVFGANCLFQPNISATAGVGTTTAHQPYGFDQWAGIYNEYTVLGAKIVITATPTNSTTASTAAGMVSCLLSDTATTYASPTTLLETGRAAYRQIAVNTSSGPVILVKKFSAKKFWSVKDMSDAQSNYGAPVGANPTEKAYFQVYFFTNDTSSSTSNGPYCWVTIDYFCLFTGPQDLSAS